MHCTLKLISIVSVVLVAGCSGQLPSAEEQIPTHVVINTVKCELAEILNDAKYKRQVRVLFGAPRNDKESTKLTLGLKIVQSSATGAGASISNILAFGGTLSPSFSLTLTTANTVETQFVSVFPNPAATSTDICRTRERMSNGIGLKAFILGIVDQVTLAEAGQPYIRSESIKYTATFGVTREAKAGADFTFVPVKLTASQLEKREDVQTITFEAPLPQSVQYYIPG